MWTMNWFATSVCSPSSDLWTLLVATHIAFTVWVTSWKSRTFAPLTASGCSCTSAVPPACWSGTCWTSWLWCAPTIQSVSSRCSAVNCSLTCTTGKTRDGMQTACSGDIVWPLLGWNYWPQRMFKKYVPCLYQILRGVQCSHQGMHLYQSISK